MRMVGYEPALPGCFKVLPFGGSDFMICEIVNGWEY